MVTLKIVMIFVVTPKKKCFNSLYFLNQGTRSNYLTMRISRARSKATSSLKSWCWWSSFSLWSIIQTVMSQQFGKVRVLASDQMSLMSVKNKDSSFYKVILKNSGVESSCGDKS